MAEFLSDISSAQPRFLVVVRAGEKSLHKAWLAGPERNWDLVVSWYGDSAYAPVADETVIAIKGGKWDGLAKTFAARPDLLSDYSYIWLPDDDIETSTESINRLFEIAVRDRLILCQPALTTDSYFTHAHTLRSASFMMRYTSMVEVMIPCVESSLLSRILPYVAAAPMGFGLDYIWTRLETNNRYRSAILDCLPMRHTRPVGKFLMSRVRETGHDPDQSLFELLGRFGLKDVPREFYCYGGRTSRGWRVGAVTTRLLMAHDFIRRFRTTQQASRLPWRFYKAFIRDRKSTDISPLAPNA